MESIQDLLRNLKVLEGPFVEYNFQEVSETPQELFLTWLQIAIDSGVKEPHALTLSTVDGEGYPDARVLILKNVDALGWYFASSSESKKGEQLKGNPKVALTFYWPLLGKQIRIRGTVSEMGMESSCQDFLNRSEMARAGALIGKQSTVLANRKQLDEAVAIQYEQIKLQSNIVYPNWVLYRVQADEVEFWQGNKD